MKREEIKQAFIQLGKVFESIGDSKPWPGLAIGATQEEYEHFEQVVKRQQVLNGWFTEANVRKSLKALSSNLTSLKLDTWLFNYSFSEQPKKVAIIMAGNIPLVGFQDFLCVLLSGNSAVCKMSSDDKTLLPVVVKLLTNFHPSLSDRILLTENRIGEVDAVIATGSDNSVKFFEQYFGKYPHIFRKNRTSVAVIDGTETAKDFEQLGHDIFDYFGLGCRNVSHLLVPKGYDFKPFFEGIVHHGDVINHFKYGNNYDYNRTVYLMNLHPMLDNNFVLLYEHEELFSPLAMIYYHTYESATEIEDYLLKYEESIQAVVGKNYIPFGAAQCPALDDYADGIDVMEWLGKI